VTEPALLTRVQAGIGFAFLVIFAAACVWARFDVPYRDDWDWILYTLAGPPGWAGVFLPHNEHVIPLARLLMRAQYAIGGLTGHLIQYVALASHLTVAAVCWREVGRRWPDRPHWRLGVGGLVLVCLAFTQQLQSIVFAAAALFPFVQLGATLAIVALLNATEGGNGVRRGWWWAATVAGVILAAGSTTSGLAVPVVLGVLAWLRGASWKVSAIWAAVTVAFVLAYAGWVGIGGPAGGSGAVAPWAPPGMLELVAYGLAIFSAGVSYVHGGAAVAIGAVVCIGMLTAGVMALVHRRRLTRLEVFALGQMAFGAASAIMVAPGRVQFGIFQAGQSRYATFVLCAIAGLVMFAASRLDRAALPGWIKVNMARISVVLSLLVIAPNLYIAVLWHAKADLLHLPYLSIRAGAPDPQWLLTLHPLTGVVTRVLDEIEASGGRVTDVRIGTTVAHPWPVASCGGEGRLLPTGRANALSLTGMWPPTLHDDETVVIDAAGVIVGLARPMPWVTEPNPSVSLVNDTVRQRLGSFAGDRSAPQAWRGFVQAGAGPPYMMLGNRQAGAWTCVATLMAAAPGGPP
jgi:hypothetical protein